MATTASTGDRTIKIWRKSVSRSPVYAAMRSERCSMKPDPPVSGQEGRKERRPQDRLPGNPELLDCVRPLRMGERCEAAINSSKDSFKILVKALTAFAVLCPARHAYDPSCGGTACSGDGVVLAGPDKPGRRAETDPISDGHS